MLVGCWNIRGLNRPLKQNGVNNLMLCQKLDILGILESKLSSGKLALVLKNKFKGRLCFDNFHLHSGGRILILWDSNKVHVDLIDISAQVIHCKATCKISFISFHISFVYAYNSVVGRRPLWLNLRDFCEHHSGPWILLGDFNTVLKPEERCNGLPVSNYVCKDFAECCEDLGLSDLPSAGCFYTWSNNTVMSKLDRVLVNNFWYMEGLFGHAVFLPSGCLSDHCPSIVSILRPPPPKRRSFKFFNMWASHEDFNGLVEGVWQAEIFGSSQFALCKKLQRLKHPLKALNVKHYSHISSRVFDAEKELDLMQQAAQTQPSSAVTHANVAELRKRCLFLKEAERLFFQQKAKGAHLMRSDKCTKFFHSMARRNAKRNFIAAIRKSDGSFTSSQAQIAEEFLGFYRNLLGTCCSTDCINPSIISSGPLLSAAHAEALIRSVSHQEIKDALFDIGDEKAPGPDGFSASFFKKAWNTVGDLFCQAVFEFFRSGKLLKQINHAVIVLIPKSAHADSVGDFRPIACCNVTYKVIAKILASRLAPMLDSFIDKAQSAFIQGRNLAENVQLAQELLRKYARKRSSPRCLIKVDLCKAYDTVNWTFLQQAMEGLGFPQLFIQWIMECISTASYSLIINGDLYGHFKGKRGLRQGDPLSSFLFVICLEYFSRSLNMATADSQFNFHPKCINLKLSHLAFADDLMLFARGDVPSINIIMNCLKDFEAKSGLQANPSKSCIFAAGIVGLELHRILDITRFSQGVMPFRYLGIPLAAVKLRINHFAPLLSKISECIATWKAITLSYAGRLELIRGVLQAIVCFWLNILPIPAGVIDHIYCLCRRFLWGSKSALVAWKDICFPKSEGGLGLKDLKIWNSCLLIKTLWDIHQKKDTLWVRWVHQEFLQGVSIWQRALHRDDSPLIKRLLLIRDRLITSCGSEDAVVGRIRSWVHGSTLNIQAAYDFLRNKAQHKFWAKIVWHPCLVPKHGFILWLCVKSRLLTRDRLLFLETNRECPFCNREEESAAHLFFLCPFTAAVWAQIRSWLGISRAMSTLSSAIKWLLKEARGSSWICKLKKITFACTVYHIWTARNSFIFDNVHPIVEALVCKVKTFVYKVIFTLYPHVLNHFKGLALGA